MITISFRLTDGSFHELIIDKLAKFYFFVRERAKSCVSVSNITHEHHQVAFHKTWRGAWRARVKKELGR